MKILFNRYVLIISVRFVLYKIKLTIPGILRTLFLCECAVILIPCINILPNHRQKLMNVLLTLILFSCSFNVAHSSFYNSRILPILPLPPTAFLH